MKLEINRPDWDFMLALADTKSVSVGKSYRDAFKDQMDDWFNEHVVPINKLLSNGVKVTGVNDDGYYFDHHRSRGDTHKALLINVQPIYEESAEQVLEDIFTSMDRESRGLSGELEELYLRAKRVLNK
jgi:hypothetical protein